MLVNAGVPRAAVSCVTDLPRVGHLSWYCRCLAVVPCQVIRWSWWYDWNLLLRFTMTLKLLIDAVSRIHIC